jgi:hypothetical protein
MTTDRDTLMLAEIRGLRKRLAECEFALTQGAATRVDYIERYRLEFDDNGVTSAPVTTHTNEGRLL